jgi:hypothetical protein
MYVKLMERGDIKVYFPEKPKPVPKKMPVKSFCFRKEVMSPSISEIPHTKLENPMAPETPKSNLPTGACKVSVFLIPP